MLYEADIHSYAPGSHEVVCERTIFIHSDNMEEAAREARFMTGSHARAVCIREVVLGSKNLDVHEELFDAKGG